MMKILLMALFLLPTVSIFTMLSLARYFFKMDNAEESVVRHDYQKQMGWLAAAGISAALSAVLLIMRQKTAGSIFLVLTFVLFFRTLFLDGMPAGRVRIFMIISGILIFILLFVLAYALVPTY